MNSNGDSVVKSPFVLCFGELLIDFVPTINGVSLAEAPAFKKAPGGAPANVAVCVARLGGSSAFIGKVKFSCKLIALCTSVYMFSLCFLSISIFMLSLLHD